MPVIPIQFFCLKTSVRPTERGVVQAAARSSVTRCVPFKSREESRNTRSELSVASSASHDRRQTSHIRELFRRTREGILREGAALIRLTLRCPWQLDRNETARVDQ